MTQDLKKIVFENLDNAKENGYFQPGEQLYGAAPAEIAADLLAYAVDCEPIDDPQLLIPFITQWLVAAEISALPKDVTDRVVGNSAGVRGGG